MARETHTGSCSCSFLPRSVSIRPRRIAIETRRVDPRRFSPASTGRKKKKIDRAQQKERKKKTTTTATPTTFFLLSCIKTEARPKKNSPCGPQPAPEQASFPWAPVSRARRVGMERVFFLVEFLVRVEKLNDGAGQWQASEKRRRRRRLRVRRSRSLSLIWASLVRHPSALGISRFSRKTTRNESPEVSVRSRRRESERASERAARTSLLFHRRLIETPIAREKNRRARS